MEAPATPPRQTRRQAHTPQTPPSPTHGPVLEDYEPYRRSSRRTLQNNKYSTANLGVSSSSLKRSPVSNRIPPLTSRTPSRKFSVSLSETLSTPPASPLPPMQAPVEGAPDRAGDNGIEHDNTEAHTHSSLTLPSQQSSSAMFPTPSKTPTMTPARRPHRAASMQDSARILHFQPEDPNDVMPSRRESRKHKSAATNDDYHINASHSGKKSKVEFSVYSEVQARVPEDDSSSANVFRASRGRGRGTVSEPESQQRARQWDSSPSPPPRSRKTAADRANEAAMDSAVSRGEGLVYTFRGKKVFRKFDDVSADEDPGAGPRQQALKRAAGGPAARPITRSNIRPRLLWTVDGREHDIRPEISYTDEEAETDLEMPEAPAGPSAPADVDHHDWSVSFPASTEIATPVKPKKAKKPMLSPPTTARTTRQTRSNDIPSFQDTLDADDEAPSASIMPTPQRSSRKKKSEVGDIPIFHDGAVESSDDAVVPPTPARTRTTRAQTHLTPIVEDSDEPGSTSATNESSTMHGKRKARSPFDNWPRRKRGSDPVDEVAEGLAAKRSRSGTRSGQA